MTNYNHQTLLNKGIRLYETRNFPAAIEVLNSYIRLDQNSWLAYSALADCYEELGRPNEAIVFYNKSIFLNSSNITSWMNLGAIYRDLGLMNHDDRNIKQAYHCYVQAAKLGDSEAQRYLNHAIFMKERNLFNANQNSNNRSFFGKTGELDFKALLNTYQTSKSNNRGNCLIFAFIILSPFFSIGYFLYV